MTETLDAWPAGSTWVFQGTVAEDATGGTHVCTLTVTPGAGNEFQVLYGRIGVGATATVQAPYAGITDGTNTIADLLLVTAGANSGGAYGIITTANAQTAGTGNLMTGGLSPSNIVSGTMQLILKVTTAAISVTQTFAVACRLKTGQKPTAVLADSVGTPVLTTNTNQVF